jgi:Cd2+/Zn2+-exporting ATPase
MVQPCSGERPGDRPWWRHVQVALTSLCAFFLAVSMVTKIPALSAWAWPGWAYLSVACGSYFALSAARDALRERKLDVNFLMVLAAAGAIAVDHVQDAAVLLFLFSLASVLEAMAMAKTRSAIEGLIQLRPATALRVEEGEDREVRVEDLQAGDLVRVLPFQSVPADARVEHGAGEVDESAMTGESRPVAKGAGDVLLAGTQNLDSMLVARVTAAVGDSTLEKIVALVRDAQENKASGERISQWFGQRYTLFVIGAFSVSLAVRAVTGAPTELALYASLTLLVALSPCALVISTPASTLSALAYAARRGVLVRGGQYIEAAGRIDVVALDKTGTITLGKPQLVEICVCQGLAVAVAAGRQCEGDCEVCDFISCWRRGDPIGEASAQMLRLAASAERFSTHPIAEAIVAAARQAGLSVPEASEHQAYPGLGLVARVEERDVKIGQGRFFGDEDGHLPQSFRNHLQEMQGRGLTAVLMRAGDTWAAFGMRDEPRPEAPALVRALRDAGAKRVVMLTGDNPETAQAVAQAVGVDEVHAGLMPADKARLIGDWSDQGQRVMMVGDGVNDAPALTRASMGVAMGGLGSDVALNASDAVLVQDRLERLPELMRLGRMANRIIRTNLLFAAAVILVLTTLSFAITLPLPIAVLGHEGSTVIVILNGLRLLRGPGT